MAAQVEVQTGEVGRTVTGGRLHLSPLSDSSNKSLVDIPSINQSHVITPEPKKPVPGPKPRLTPKPFAVEKNPTIKPILAPKPQTKPRPESTRPAGYKPELPSSPKPQQPVAKPRPVSTSSNRPAPTTFKTLNKLNTGQTTKPVVQPFKPAPPLDPGDARKPTSSVQTERPRPTASSLGYSKSLKKLPAAEWSGSTKREDERDKIISNNGGASITRAKSLGFLVQVGQEEEDKGKPKPEATVLLRPHPRGSRPRPVSAIYLDSPSKTEAPVPAPRWTGRRPLSADLTSKFETAGLSLLSKSPKVNSKDNTPEQMAQPQKRVQEKTPKSTMPQSTDGVAKPDVSDQSNQKTEETDEDTRGVSIKSRINLLLDSSSIPGAVATGQVSDLQSPVPENEPTVGVKQLIKQLTVDTTPTQSPVTKPPLKPRPLPLDLTKRFASERSPDIGGEATEHHDISKDSQRRNEESALTPSDHRTFVDLKDSHEQLKKASMPEGPEAGPTFGVASKESDPSGGVQTVRASLFENVVERHSVFMMEESKLANKPNDSLSSLSLRRGNDEDEGTLVTATYKEPVSPSSPLCVVHAFDTVQAIEENRAVSENIPSAQWEDKAMTLRSRRSEGTKPVAERTGLAQTEPAPAMTPEPQPRYLRVGALPKWNATGQDGGMEKVMPIDVQREGQRAVDKDRHSEAEQEEVAGAPKRLKMLQAEDQQKPRATYFALTGQIQEPASPVDTGVNIGDMAMPFDFSVRSVLGGSQGKILPPRRNPSLDEAFGNTSQDQLEEVMMRNHMSHREIRSAFDLATTEETMEVEKKKDFKKESEKQKAKMKELEREKQRQLEVEYARMKEREMQREFERQRQIAFEKEKQEFERKQRALERQKQIELEKQKQLEIEKLKQIELEKQKEMEAEKLRLIELEKQKQIEAEKLRLIELEKQKQIELEKQRLQQLEREKRRELEKEKQRQERQRAIEKEKQERERQREQERQRQREEERQRELDKERKMMELQKEKQKMEELERMRELEKQQLLEFQRQKQKEREKQQVLELEKQRLKEKMEREEAEKIRQMALEHEMLRLREIEKEKQREVERQREMEREKQRELERQRQLDMERQELEKQRLRQEQEKERQRKEEMERLKELERRQLLEFEKQKKAERERQMVMEHEKRRLKEKMEREEAEKIRQIAKQQEAERQRLKEKQRREEQERARLESSALRPKVLDLDSVFRDDPFPKAAPQRSDPATRWKEPSQRVDEPYKPSILDVDTFTSHTQLSPSKDLFPVSSIQGGDSGFASWLQPTPERDISWKVPPQTLASLTTPVWTAFPQDPWELQPVEMSVDKPAPEVRKAPIKPSLDQLLLRQEERAAAPQRHWSALLDEPLNLAPFTGTDAKTGSSHGGVAVCAPAEQIWFPRELQVQDSRDVQIHRRSQGSQELNRMRSRSVSRRSAPSSSAVEGSLSRMRSRSAHRERDRHSWVQQKQSVSGEEEGNDSETPLRETDSQYGTWETGLRTDDSLTPATPSSESNLSPSPRKPTPPHTPGDRPSQFGDDTLDSLLAPSSSDSQPLSFPDAPTALLDTSALRSKAQLGKKRAPRTRPSRAARQTAAVTEVDGGNTEDWLYRDSTEAKVESKDDDSDSEEQTRGADTTSAVSSQPQRIPLFPGMDPSALKAQLKKRGDSDNQMDGSSPNQLSRSPKSPFLPRAARVLPPSGGKENGEEESPQWLKELKSKKRLSQYENEN